MSHFRMEKFNVPAISTMVIKRERLISIMNKLSARGILYVHAPAGYGKTTASVQWLQCKKSKAAWFTLDTFDTLPSDFYKGVLIALTASMSDAALASINKTLAAPEYDYFSLGHMLNILSGLNFTSMPDAFVIDDFHLGQGHGTEITQSLPVIRSRLPSNLRMVVISRNPPPSELYEYIIKGLIKQIALNELQFSEAETTDLFILNGMRINDYYVEQVQRQTLGWPAAIGALLLAARSDASAPGYMGKQFHTNPILKPPTYSNKLIFNEYLNNYLADLILGSQDVKARRVLMQTAVCDGVSPELCKALTGQQDAWETITVLSKKTGLIMKHESDRARLSPLGQLDTTVYHYHGLIKDFLLAEFEADKSIDKRKVYFRAATWYKQTKDMPTALMMAVKSDNLAFAEDIQRTQHSYGQFNTGLLTYVDAVEQNILRSLPTETLETSPRFSLECLLAEFTLGRLEEAVKWKEIERSHISNGMVKNPNDIVTASLLFALDPEESSWIVPREFKKIKSQIVNERSNAILPSVSLTFNMPFFHRAQRDYTDISPELDAFLTEARAQAAPVFGPVYTQLELLLESGVCFERGDLSRAKEVMSRINRIVENSTPEIRFSSYLLLCEICWYEGNQSEVKKILDKTKDMISETKSSYLTANFNAYIANQALYNGDVTSAETWLSQNPGFEKTPLALHKCFQSLTAARALIVINRLPAAVDYLDKICEFSMMYRRNADYIEACALRSVCLWRMSKSEMAIRDLISSVSKAQELELPMPVMKHGADVLPILQKLLNKIKLGHDIGEIDKAFVQKLFLNAKVLSGYYGGLFAKTPDKPIKLSKQQTSVLKLLSQNMSYKEMSAATGTKITTIRDHVSKLYRKLGVTNAGDALLKANELEIL